MKRKICFFLLAFLLLLALTPAALADGAQLSYITDDAGVLTASETASLEKAAQHRAALRRRHLSCYRERRLPHRQPRHI